MRPFNPMPEIASIKNIFAIYEDGGNAPKTLEQLVQILDDSVEDLAKEMA